MGAKDLKKYRECKKKFKELDTNRLELEPGEKFKHCDDSRMFNGKYYHPNWVVTNKGRVWSLHSNDWMNPQITNGYWVLKDGGTVYIHKLVCYYFQNESDRVALKHFKEEELEVHHIRPIDIPPELNKMDNKDDAVKEDKIKQCMKDSCKENVVYQEKRIDHHNDTEMANGNITSQEKYESDEWEKSLQKIRENMQQGEDFGTYYVYSEDENGNLLRKYCTLKAHINGTEEQVDDVILGDYIVNAGSRNFVLAHQDEILEMIKKYPPKKPQYKNRYYEKGRGIEYLNRDGKKCIKFVLYARKD